MNKYILSKERVLIKLDTETLNINTVRSQYNIDYMWLIEEDGTITFCDKEYEVKAGNIVMLMYCIGDEKCGDIIVVDNEELTNNWKRRIKFYEEQSKKVNDKCECCDCITSCKDID